MGIESSPRRVVLCADDYALSASVSRGIEALAAQGRLSATSVMVLAPRWPQDAARLRACVADRAIDVGLHLDWTSPYARAAGHGVSLPVAMLRAVLGAYDPRTARAVIERQLDAFEAHWGAPPDHVDGHQHVQQFAGIAEALVEVLSRRYGARPPWLRLSEAPAPLRDAKSRVIAALGAARLRRRAREAGLPIRPWLIGISDFAADATAFGARLAHGLAHAPDGSVCMSHPGSPEHPHDPLDGIARAREAEYAWLSGPAFPETLARLGVQLVRGRACEDARVTLNPAVDRF